MFGSWLDGASSGNEMSKETRIVVLTLATPLVLAVAGWINAHSAATKAEEAKFAMSDSFQEYIEYIMEQRGCEP